MWSEARLQWGQQHTPAESTVQAKMDCDGITDVGLMMMFALAIDTVNPFHPNRIQPGPPTDGDNSQASTACLPMSRRNACPCAHLHTLSGPCRLGITSAMRSSTCGPCAEGVTRSRPLSTSSRAAVSLRSPCRAVGIGCALTSSPVEQGAWNGELGFRYLTP